jgi:hypothetical protein
MHLPQDGGLQSLCGNEDLTRSPQVVGKISGLLNKMQELVSKAKSFTFAAECATDKCLVNKPPRWKSSHVFIPDTTLPPSPIGRSQVQNLSLLAIDEVKGKINI